ncbi:MAG TPA: flagellar assembly protein FliW [Verrucomicrobiae bacterium]|nr:flagellar assembly protein FliW [Verrucomicrobiae bacterium]
MKFAELNDHETGAPVAQAEQVVQLPLGLLGFERYKRFALTSSPEEAPFLWLQVVDDADLAFLVVSPFVVDPGYSPDIPDTDAQFLGLKGPHDALVFNIVTLHKHGPATINLKGPIVINRHTFIGKQVVPLNAADLSLRHPLPAGA